MIDLGFAGQVWTESGRNSGEQKCTEGATGRQWRGRESLR